MAFVLCFVVCATSLDRRHRLRWMSCPLCKTAFPTLTGGEGGFVHDHRLDLMPTGGYLPCISLPVCPKCSFVLFKGAHEQIPADELERCRKIVSGNDYKKFIGRSSYCWMGALFEGLMRDDSQIAHAFLGASWQEAAEPKKRSDDLQRSYDHFQAFIKATKEHQQSWQTAQLLCGEILRQLREIRRCPGQALGGPGRIAHRFLCRASLERSSSSS